MLRLTDIIGKSRRRRYPDCRPVQSEKNEQLSLTELEQHRQKARAIESLQLDLE